MRRWWLAAALLALGCDDRPVVNVALVPADVDVPALSTFSRVTLAVDRCDVDVDVVPELHALDVAAGSRPELELDILPGAPVSVWVAAWAGAAVAYEGCSDFARFEAGSESTINLTLSATRTPRLCPTPRAACP